MLKVELITNYFPPEMGAAASRMYNLAKGLQDLGYDVEVIAPLPNYPEFKIPNAYKNTFKRVEYIEGVKTQRVWIAPPASKSRGVRFLQMLSFPVAMWSTLAHLLKRDPHIILIQNTPLWVSFSAMVLSMLLPNSRRILNVSDLWPLTAVATGVMSETTIKYRTMVRMEQFNYRCADMIMGQSNEILQHAGDKADKPLFLYRNISPAYGNRKIGRGKYHHGQPKIIYAGLLSPVQGVHAICENIGFHEAGAEFHIYGSGEEQKKIQNYIREHPGCNIYYHGRISQDELHEILPGFHASIVPLANPIFGAVPSKLFELTAFGVPVLFCGAGEGAKLIKNNSLGYVSEPHNMQSLQENIQQLIALQPQEYQTLLDHCAKFTSEKLDFEKQLRSLSQEIKTISKRK